MLLLLPSSCRYFIDSLRAPSGALFYGKYAVIFPQKNRKHFGFTDKFTLTFGLISCIIVGDVKVNNFTEGGIRVKNQTYRMTMLFDFYGEVLTQRQKEFFDLYYNEDLSLGEIAENYGISRQGVRDVIVRAEGVMQEIEDKTGLLRRFMQMQDKLDAITQAARDIQTINYRQHENPELDRLAQVILTNADALKE